jgi:hypothetical protein
MQCRITIQIKGKAHKLHYPRQPANQMSPAKKPLIGEFFNIGNQILGNHHKLIVLDIQRVVK